MTSLNNTEIEKFIISTSLIDPVNKILIQLENGDFRDCDISWLDDKLEAFTEFACKTLNLNVIMPKKALGKNYTTLNEFVKKQYSERFNILLRYFKYLNE